MQSHGTAVLARPAEAAAPVSLSGASARDRWLAKCESQLAEALATGNAHLLPVLAHAVFLPRSLTCPDCHGTGYTSYDNLIELCYCMAGEYPAYDFRRHAKGGIIATVTGSATTPDDKAEVWVPCPCGIGPVKVGPYDGDDLTRVPWVPDCPTCHDTGWTFSHRTNAQAAFLW
jgi:hypothetical protein